LACAQLQHQQANDTLLLVAIGTVLVVGGQVWLTGQVAGLPAAGSAGRHDVCVRQAQARLVWLPPMLRWVEVYLIGVMLAPG
jgi:hypothetical protein